MTQPLLPLVVDPQDLKPLLRDQRVLLVDLSNIDSYMHQHLPGAHHVEFAKLLYSRPPVMGLLPPEAALRETLSTLGLTTDHHVVAYDNENGGKACRFLWTLEIAGHAQFSLLNGGLRAWLAADGEVTRETPVQQSSKYTVHLDARHLADKQFLLEHLQDPDVKVLDVRSPAEFSGADRRAARGGHIPGAVNIEWTRALASGGTGQLRSAPELRALFESAGVTPDKDIVVHCQTHQRSAHTYIVLKSLGYSRVRGYPGSWSDWGNDPAVPIA